MRVIRTIILALVSLIAACSADGGSRGSGISTAQGNVATASAAARRPPALSSTLLARLAAALRPIATAFARSEVEGIDVVVEGTRFAGRTDAAGFFSVQGGFSGTVALRFQRADDGLDVRLVSVVPPGATLTLENVRLARSGSASVDRQDVSFDSSVTAVACPTINVITSEGPGGRNTFAVDVSAATIRNDDGAPLACSTLVAGDRVQIEGTFAGDGTIAAASVEVRGRSSGGGDDGGDGDDGTRIASDGESGPGGGDDTEGDDDSGGDDSEIDD